ncbi:MAG: sugar ABC transporter permease [Treponema sp.]|jgi:ABC-type sugar transport system permease subunit|nr:sugar ABC transporter permease [Treponema sp.]
MAKRKSSLIFFYSLYKKYHDNKWDKIALLFIAPYVIFCAVFFIYPMFMAIAGSVARWDLVTNKFTSFIGLRNYIALFKDMNFLLSVRNSFIYFFVQIPTSIVGGMILASLLNERFAGRIFFRGLFFLPVITGSVILAIVWKWIFQTNGGVLNYLVSLIGINQIGWLTDQKLSMLSISLMKAWMDIGYYSIIFLGAYQAISSELIEAALIDGANAVQTFFRVKLPLLNPTVIFSIMMATIWAFQIFNEPYIMTEGGPMGSSSTMTLYLYRQGFIRHQLSYASAIGVFVGVLIMLISIIERKIFERNIY